MSSLVSEVAEFALDCLEKRDALVPFCKLRKKTGESVFISVENEASTFEQAARAVREELRRQIQSGDVAQFAISTDKEVKYQHLTEPCRVLEVEYQDGTPESAIYHFVLTVERGRASIDSQYRLLDLREKML